MKEISFFTNEFKKFFGRKRLDSLILYVTSRCNAKCRFCFYQEDLNSAPELSLAEIIKISGRIPSLKGLLIGGGEPFLRSDLTEIVAAFVSHSQVEVVQIPTNGYFSDRTVSLVQDVTSRFPRLNLAVQVSLDAVGEKHDAMRGLKGCFRQAEKTISALKALRKKETRLRILVVSVLSQETLPACPELITYVKETINPDYHWFEPVRGAPSGEEALPLSPETIVSLRDNLKYYLRKSKGATSSIYNSKLFSNWITAFSLNNFDIAYNNLLLKKPWPVRCCAGERMAVIYPDGRLSPCELRKESLNIKDFDYNITAALRDRQFQKLRQDTLNHICDCTHGCFIPSSVRYSPAELLRVLWKANFL